VDFPTFLLTVENDQPRNKAGVYPQYRGLPGNACAKIVLFPEKTIGRELFLEKNWEKAEIGITQ
jgi:hypothetical protein